MHAAGPHRENAARPPLLVVCDFTAGVSYINIIANVLNVPARQDLMGLKYYSESQNIHGKMNVICLGCMVSKKLLC